MNYRSEQEDLVSPGLREPLKKLLPGLNLFCSQIPFLHLKADADRASKSSATITRTINLR